MLYERLLSAEWKTLRKKNNYEKGMNMKTNSNDKLNLIFYSLENYDQQQYERYARQFNMKFLSTQLNENTAVFSFNCDVVVACPMDKVTAPA